jgi:hypothetical protein
LTAWIVVIPQRLAEITGTDLSSFEAHFQDQMLFVVILYGVVFVVGLALLFGFTIAHSEPSTRLG